MAFYAEIFTDRDAHGEISTGPVKHGLSYVESIVGYPIVLTRENRRLKLTSPGVEAIDPVKIRWPILPATFSFVLTDRPILMKTAKGKGVTNTSLGLTTQLGGKTFMPERIALITTFGIGITELESNATHELGHMMEINTDESDMIGHCSTNKCLMQPTNIQSPLRSILGAVSRFGNRHERLEILSEVENLVARPRTEFCSDCTQDLAGRSAALHILAAQKAIQFYDQM
jgi:hypothetical protein